MSRFSLGHNGVTETVVHFEGDQMITEEVQDVAPVLEANRRILQLEQSRHSPMRLAASIPIIVYEQWKREFREKYSDVWTWKTYLAMKLNSRDSSKLRTTDMRI